MGRCDAVGSFYVSAVQFRTGSSEAGGSLTKKIVDLNNLWDEGKLAKKVRSTHKTDNRQAKPKYFHLGTPSKANIMDAIDNLSLMGLGNPKTQRKQCRFNRICQNYMAIEASGIA